VRIARFAAGDEVSYGLVGTAREGRGASGAGAGAKRGGGTSGAPAEQVIAELAGHPLGGATDGIRLTGTTYLLTDVRLLAPVLPSKVIGFGPTGPGTGSRADQGPADGSVLYLKPSTAVCGPSDAIRYPGELTRSVTAEGDLAVVIGRLCRGVPASQAAGVIFGYTCATDVTARDLAERDGQWARAKGFDTFCPLGPWIETGADPGEAALTTAVNGEVRGRGGGSQLRQSVPALVAYASSVMTLLPGDVLLIGTAVGAGWGGVAGSELAGWPVEPGDEVSVTVDGIGTLTNKVEKGD
jgi:2-keto-4-pentenoate hydratase/2-oxohepta-3-ene-1,7-dioic acid hydratase in catechol pathway